MNYIIYGTSYKLIDSEIKKIQPNKEYQTYSLLDTSINTILEDISYNAMFTEEKTIIIKNSELLFENKKENTTLLEKLSNYLKDTNNTIILISTTKISTKYKDILTYFQIIETPIITKPYELTKFLGNYIYQMGYRIDPNSLEMLSNKCLNIDIALNELDKLKLIKEDKIITKYDIDNYISNYNTSDMFGLKDAILSKNIKLANTLLTELETSKVEIVPLIVMITKEYETLYNVLALSQKRYTNEEIGKYLNNMHPYRIKIFRELSSKYNLEEIKRLILYLCNLDLKMVSLDNTGYDELRYFLLML